VSDSPNTGQPWNSLQRPLPAWFRSAPLGIFVHWGAYSVPAWAEPIGALGTVDDARYWYTHVPYAEWYANTIRIDGSPAQQHHRTTYGDLPYDGLLDLWKAEAFDPADWASLFRAAGADYVVPTTKHHDGITLWDAPGTEGRNTVERGPRRDLVGDLADAVRTAGLRLGVYYSGGLDWHVRPFPPHSGEDLLHDERPLDAEYATYAYEQVADLVDRYHPSILWNDIEWPDAGKHFDAHGLGRLFQHFYNVVPDGVVNDRWGRTHFDYRTSEYEQGREVESQGAWENCRGLGFSFGHNQVEAAEHTLSGHEVVRHLVDVVARGGRLLLNVGPRADGTIPDLQRRSLTDLGHWMRFGKRLLVDAEVVPQVDTEVWARRVRRPEGEVLFVDVEPGEAGSVALAKLGTETRDPRVVGEGGGITGGTLELVAERPGPVAVLLPGPEPR